MVYFRKHVEYITNQVTKKLAEYIHKKKKITVKTNYIKENIFVFIRSLIIFIAESIYCSTLNIGIKIEIIIYYISKETSSINSSILFSVKNTL